MKKPLLAEKFSEEMLMARAVAETNAKNPAFYHAGEAYILSAAEFTEQWEAVDNFYTLKGHTATEVTEGVLELQT